MDYEAGHEAHISFNDVNIENPEVDLNKVGILERASPDGVFIGALGNVGEVLTRVELDLACASEKLVNLSDLMMHVATKESDFEAFASKEEQTSVDSVEKALEFTLLSVILVSEVNELDKLMAILQRDITSSEELLSSYTYVGETFAVVEEKLCDSEQSLKQLQDQVAEIKVQSLKYQRTFSCFDGEENWNSDKGVGYLEDDNFSSMNVKIKLQTAEQQRHILRMLEKSLAREMDLEKKLTESKQIVEDLSLRLCSSEQEVYCMEDEAADGWERWLEADNASGVMMGISKELLGRLQILQFNLNGSLKREAELRSQLEGMLNTKESTLRKLESSNAKLNDFFVAQTSSLKDNLKEAEDKLIIANSEAFTLREKVSSLEEQHNSLCSEISEMENIISELKKNVSKAEGRADNAEAKCKLLTDTNTELNEELGLLKRQIREHDIQLQHALASAEASQEKQNMLYSTIRDMEGVIEDLKLNVLKAESRADSTEDKCITLSESNAELNEELSFLRGRLECLEAALHQAEEAKIATATDIGIRSKVITNLIMKLAFERERLHKQISSLAMENSTLVLKLQMNNHPSVVVGNDDRGNGKDVMLSKHDLATGTRENKEEAYELSASNSKLSVGETELRPTSSTSEIETVRRIDAGVLSIKHLLAAIVILLISAAVYFFLQQGCPF